MLLIYTSNATSRFRYIAGLMVGDLLGIDFKVTSDPAVFRRHEGPGLAYSDEEFTGVPRILPAGLLTECTIRVQGVAATRFDGVPVIFQANTPGSALPFDPFAAGFYMVTRYEEYLPFTKDKYGRFPATESIALQGNFLDLPVVHHWAEMIGRMLVRVYPDIQRRERKYRYLPTVDVDHAFCYRGRTMKRTLGGAARSLFNGRIGEVAQRFRVLAGMAGDPFDTFDYIRRVLDPYDLQPLFFILFADYGGDDNNVRVNSKAFHRLVRSLDHHQGVGVHPSLSSNKHYLKLHAECEGLGRLLSRQVVISRQHFLKLSVPKTYRALNQLGITADYSMGYATHAGFRAGIAIPFPFFDVARDMVTPLVVHPITLMDVTMKDYLRLTCDQSLELTAKFIRTVKSVNGEFVSLWHNESLAPAGRWLGWRRVFEEMVKMAST